MVEQRSELRRHACLAMCVVLGGLSVVGCGGEGHTGEDHGRGLKDSVVIVGVPFGETPPEQLLGESDIVLVTGSDITPIAQQRVRASDDSDVATWEEVTIETVLVENPTTDWQCGGLGPPPRGISAGEGRLAVEVFGGSVVRGSVRLIMPGSARLLTCKPRQRCLLIGALCGRTFRVRHGEGMLNVSDGGALSPMAWEDARSVREMVRLRDVQTLVNKAKEMQAAPTAQ